MILPFNRLGPLEPTWFLSRFSVILATKIFVVALCLSLIAIDSWRSWNAHTTRHQEAQATISDLARALSQHAEDTFIQADTVLVSLVERLETEGKVKRHRQRLNSLLKRHVSELHQLHGLYIYDQTGRWLVNSRQTLPNNANNSDRDYFVFHRDNPSRKPFIGPPVKSRSTGDWILTLSRRFNHPDGSFAGVVLATIYMNYFNEYYGTFDIGGKGTIIMNLRDGTILVRRPFVEKWIGHSMKDAPLFRDHLPHAKHGTYLKNKSVLDGIERMTSYRQLDRFPLVVAVSLAKDEVFAGWWANTWQNFVAVSMIALLLGLMGFRLIHHINQHFVTEKMLLHAQEELQGLNRHLETIAMQDSLTGLANRRQFDAALINEFGRAMRNQSSLSLLMIDVDAFKQFNDIYGHLAGDECLKRIGTIIETCQQRSGDLTARYGGEEIAVLLPETDMEGAFKVAEKIRSSISGLQIPHRGSATGVITISCGVASIVPGKEGNDPMELVSAADRALYTAKENGRNLVCRAPNELIH